MCDRCCWAIGIRERMDIWDRKTWMMHVAAQHLAPAENIVEVTVDPGKVAFQFTRRGQPGRVRMIEMEIPEEWEHMYAVRYADEQLMRQAELLIDRGEWI